MSRRTAIKGSAALLSGLAVASLVVADFHLSQLVPQRWWGALLLDAIPYRVTIVALAALLLLTLTAHLFVRAGDFRAFWIVALMIGAQTNGFRLGPINPLDVCNLIAMSALLAHHLLRARDNDANSDILFPMVVLAGAALLALQVPTFLYQNPVRWIIGSLALLKVVLLAAIVVNLVRSWRLLRVAADALVAVALLSGIAAIGQFVLSFFFGINLTLMDDPEAAFKPTPLGMIMRASGFCITAQHLSSFLLFALPFLLWRLFAPRDRLGPGLARRLLLLVGVGVLLAGILATWNFGALFVTAAVVLLFPFVRWPRASVHIALAYALTVLLAYYTGLFDLVYELSFGDSGVAKGVDQREALMLFGFEKLQRDWFLGVGVHEMANFTGNYWRRPVHNAYLQAFTEIGFLGGVVFLGLLLVTVTRLFLAAFRIDAAHDGLVRPMILTGLGLLGIMFSEPMFDHSNTWLTLGLAQATLLLTLRGNERVIPTPATSQSPSSDSARVQGPSTDRAGARR